MSKFKNRLNELRLEKGLKQTQLAKLVKTKQSTISKWEKGLLEPNIKEIIILADIFNVCIDYLLGRKDYY